MNTALAVIFVFGLLIFVHELGHFTVAKLVGIRVYEFSIGFGPKVIKFRRGETRYHLRLLPLGGFVRMAGMDEDEDLNEMKKLVAEDRHIKVEEISPEEEETIKATLDDSRAFKNKTVLQRIAVIFAGSFNNFVLAFILFFLIFFAIGAPTQDLKNPVIGDVSHDQAFPAEKAGLKAGDRILTINGTKINNWEQLTDIIHKSPDEKLNIKIQRDHADYSLTVLPIKDQDGQGKIGIVPKTIFVPQTFSNSIVLATVNFKGIFGEITRVLGSLFVDKSALKEIGGPARIVTEIGKAAKMGLINLLYFTAAISINLGIFNLLPIPALDGSRIVFLLYEAVRGKPVDPNKENMVHLVGFALLMVLIAVITYRDVFVNHLGG